jgi:hypothetical protein
LNLHPRKIGVHLAGSRRNGWKKAEKPAGEGPDSRPDSGPDSDLNLHPYSDFNLHFALYTTFNALILLVCCERDEAASVKKIRALVVTYVLL